MRYFLALMLALSSALAGEKASVAEFAKAAGGGAGLNVVFLGGSLTWGAGATDPQRTSWRALISRKLEERFPAARFQFWDAAIGGTGSQLGAFRLERDVLARQPALVFLEFTINDDPYAPLDPVRLASYESLVRRLVSRGIPVVQVILPSMRDATDAVRARPLDAAHREIASDYGLPSADAVALLRERVAGGVAPGTLWDVPGDRTHPGDAGYALYAEAVGQALDAALAAGVVCRLPEKMRYADTYLSVNRARLCGLPLPAGWTAGQPHRNALAYDFVCSRWMDDVAIASPQAAPLLLKVKGSDIFLFGEATPESGGYEVRIDGGSPQSFSAKNPGGNMRHVQALALGLDPAREHVVEITPRLQAGEELRLESLCVAGAPAQVSP